MSGKPADRIPIALAWTGASGLAYGRRLAEVLLDAGRDVDLLVSDAVAQTAEVELGTGLPELLEAMRERAASGPARLRVFGKTEYGAPVASGSAVYAGMVICPCSMSTLARVASGAGDTLLLRAADVFRKERRPLILVPRETPLATHHLRNMADLSADGVLILPAMPGFYNRPASIGDLVDFIVQRICDHLGVEVDLCRRWDGLP